MEGQEVWFIAALLYVFDSIKTRPTLPILRYSLEGVSARLAEPEIIVFGRPAHIPNPLRPDICEFSLGNKGGKGILSGTDQYFIRRAASFYVVHQLVSVAALLLLFVVTPILAQRMSLLQSCLSTVLITYALCALHWGEMWRHRLILGIDANALRADIIHVLLCPPNAVNSARRLAALPRLRYDAARTLRTFSPLEAERYEMRLQYSEVIHAQQ